MVECHYASVSYQHIARVLGETPQAEIPLRAWFADASRATWKTPADIKAALRNASFVGSNRVVFNINGNDYRLIVTAHYNRGMMYIRFVGTHKEYDAIDAGKV